MNSHLLTHEAPFDWPKIQEDILHTGGVIAKGLFSEQEVSRFNGEVDGYLTAEPEAGTPHSGSDQYNRFLGGKTIRLQGLIEKTATAASWISKHELVDWATETVKPIATSVLLNAAELIQIGPGEPNQYVHRDTDSWPTAHLGETPLIVNALIALDKFTEENGATRLIPNSWSWGKDRRADQEDFIRAVMSPGDGLLFRGDILHGGGANMTDSPRRALSISYCAGWLRPVENSVFNLPLEKVRQMTPQLQQLLGFTMYDGSDHKGGLLGLYENGDPSVLLS